MKSIELNTAAVDNSGRRIEAGERLAVGTRDNQIDADRAKELVSRAGASAIRETKAATAPKPGKKKAVSKPNPAPAPAPAQSPAALSSPDNAQL